MPALTQAARLEYYFELGHSLPRPIPNQPEHRERRLLTALDAFDTLRPGDAFEGRLAVQIVLCGAHAADCLREADLYPEDFSRMTRCRAQAASMMREERAARHMLAQEQKARLAAEGVVSTPDAQPAAAAPPPQAEPPAPTQAEAPPKQPAPTAAAPSPEAIAAAEAFAQKHKAAAAWIRNDRGVTRRCKMQFRRVTMPTDPAVIDALIRGAGVKTLGAAA